MTRLLEELSIIDALGLERAERLDRHLSKRYSNAWPELPPHEHYSRFDAEEDRMQLPNDGAY